MNNNNTFTGPGDSQGMYVSGSISNHPAVGGKVQSWRVTNSDICTGKISTYLLRNFDKYIIYMHVYRRTGNGPYKTKTITQLYIIIH